ncbi:uncharacterized protein EI90DRAFT_3146783 [Cantharellus anzutake]|uniref:uncharacterized protein n=1 Tax=Cantharellus anzutake TaxID=1750568 RepID=UPI001908A079|nr:uncharacterized protein EI90DRAFT_3146783 [Cantharellus anzutake]KAF8324917.1 hypothetical protein EI90DRAFT_3146783 [Cantharellus anzutake]
MTAPSSFRTPAKRLWISVWFALSTLIVTWDAGYLLLRPRSMQGGDLFWLWRPYHLYSKIDYLMYRRIGLWAAALAEGDGFPSAQALMNLAENILNLLYLYQVHLSPDPSTAPIAGFAVATMTFWKTVLYWLQDWLCGWCTTGHNDWSTWILLWVFPNGLWLVMPLAITFTLWGDIVAALSFSSVKSIKTF